MLMSGTPEECYLRLMEKRPRIDETSSATSVSKLSRDNSGIIKQNQEKDHYILNARGDDNFHFLHIDNVLL
ncbi:hypothetical protein SBF1_9260003 [Candidatus Desulfosporosinus infrequens]|uniref:Uncharacterized protein n=1 Tax=Candidatus Desulfosporosinus infrequens TaxID=2043169 RepID=A0A2U3LXL9_9FIRM|nr:hypothetical protein SBF1_9260003 [Candidatus Desulfosporosinus infrequens]